MLTKDGIKKLEGFNSLKEYLIKEYDDFLLDDKLERRFNLSFAKVDK